MQALLGGHVYCAHELTYAGEALVRGHCGHPITGELKTKMSSTGEQTYVYYRCAKYNRKGHPRLRVTEADLDKQILAAFDRMRIDDASVREWFGAVLRSQTRDSQEQAQTRRSELQRQLSAVLGQQDRLVNLRLNDEIDADTFAKKQLELRDREAGLKLNMEALDRSHHEIADLAVKAFELSQTLREQWLSADHVTKRRILEIVCLNCKLVDATLVCEMRKPFDVLAEGLLSTNSRDDRI